MHNNQIEFAALKSPFCLKCRKNYLPGTCEPIPVIGCHSGLLQGLHLSVCVWSHPKGPDLQWVWWGQAEETREKHFINIWEIQALVPATIQCVAATQMTFTLHGAFVLVYHPNPWEFTHYWMLENFTQILISQQCSSNSMKNSEVTSKYLPSKHLPVLLHPKPTYSSSAQFPSMFTQFPGTFTYMQKEWANKD